MKKLLILISGMFFVFVAAGTASADCGLCGDINGDGAVNISDVVALVEWIYPPHITPACPCAADVNCDHAVRVNCDYDPDPGWECDDLEYLMDYIFRGGPPPCDMDDNGTPDCSPCY